MKRIDWDLWLTLLLYLAIPMLLWMMIWTNRAMAYPEMVRHGYSNCLACHVSPSGGGLLTPYGVTQSDQLLPVIPLGREMSEGPVSLGAQLRALQIQVDTPQSLRQQLVLMQADMEAAVSYGMLSFAGTVGPNPNGEVFSRRHYAVFRPTDWLSLRAGRFLPFVGLGLPDHNLNIRRGLGPGSERYAAELGLNYACGSTFFSLFKGGGTIRQMFHVEQFEFGTTIFMHDEKYEGGPFVFFSPHPRVFIMVEALMGADKGARGYYRVAWEPTRGLIPYLAHQLGDKSFGGVGLQLYPITGLELRAEYDKTGDGYTAWVMGNLWF